MNNINCNGKYYFDPYSYMNVPYYPTDWRCPFDNYNTVQKPIQQNTGTNKITQLEKENKQLKKEISFLTHGNSQLQIEKSKLVNDNHELFEKINSLTSEKTQLQNKLTSNKIPLQNKLTEKINLLTAEKTQLLNNNKLLSTEIENFKLEQLRYKKDLENMSGFNNKICEENKTNKILISDLNNYIKKLETELFDIKHPNKESYVAEGVTDLEKLQRLKQYMRNQRNKLQVKINDLTNIQQNEEITDDEFLLTDENIQEEMKKEMKQILYLDNDIKKLEVKLFDLENKLSYS